MRNLVTELCAKNEKWSMVLDHNDGEAAVHGLTQDIDTMA